MTTTLLSRLSGSKFRASLALVGALAVAALWAPALATAQHGEEEVVEEGHDGVAHAGAVEEGEHGEHGEAHAPEWDYVRMAGQFTNFAIWLALIIYFVRKNVPGYLENRKRSLVEGLEEARRMKEEAERKVADYTDRIDNLDAELAKMRAEMKEGGLAERDRIVKEASDRAEKMHAEARFLVQQQMKSLREELTREAIEAAITAAEKILREQAGAADQQRLATDYLAQLERQLKTSAEEAR